ncbi:CHRD domain-containing protein [Leptobacterium flavescens]|uniref:CHRD domain-containing protein n=1 Tax=Leptobacterium flavescens TaxID=472055 RepID=UPI0019531B46|nr:CHRD domain-containing protein [Leptobacterium flavescens]
MKKLKLKRGMFLSLIMVLSLSLTNCSNDDEEILTEPEPELEDTADPVPTGEAGVFQLGSVSNERIYGTATFLENDDNSVTVRLALTNTIEGVISPAHIHMGTAAEGGDIVISLESVDGDSGYSTTTFTTLDDGTPVTYEEILNFNGYINVHESEENLATLIAQGDVGQNALTGEFIEYPLNSVDNPAISGVATFAERNNGNTLVTLQLENTIPGVLSPSHIHMNTAAEGGDIVISLTDVNGDNGLSRTSVRELNDGTPINYEQLLDFNGYINVHESTENLANLIGQGDIGQNALTGESIEYPLNSVDNPAISGVATFAQRNNGYTLVTLQLENTIPGVLSPSHIHMNTAAEGGDIVISLTDVNGDNGLSRTSVNALNDGTPINYEQLLDFNGYINVHESAQNLANLIGQGDIGQNALTGESIEYPLNSVDNPSISGVATFAQRNNGYTLVTLQLENTIPGVLSPSHIHMNTAAEGGEIVISLTDVNGDNGLSRTSVNALNDGTPINYEQLLDFNGYINVHESAQNLANLIGQGDIGQNALTGESVEYPLNSVDNPAISGVATFAQRNNGYTLVTLQLENTIPGVLSPSHIHMNTAAEGGEIVISLTDVNGDNGLSRTSVNALNDGTPINYEQLLDFNGYINVHESAQNLANLIGQGDIGQNALTGESIVYPLNSIDNPAISGTATFAQRNNGYTLVTLQLENTIPGVLSPSHIHMNDAITTGPIVISLTDVNGDNGLSRTSVNALNDGTPINYEQLLDFDGYINVHESTQNLANLIGQGNIGSNF